MAGFQKCMVKVTSETAAVEEEKSPELQDANEELAHELEALSVIDPSVDQVPNSEAVVDNFTE